MNQRLWLTQDGFETQLRNLNLKWKYLKPIVELYASESIDKELLQNTCNCDSNEPVLLD